MEKDFEVKNDIGSDIASDVSNDTRSDSDFSDDIAKDDGVDLNNDTHLSKYTYADYLESGEVSNPFQSEGEYEPNEYTDDYVGNEYNLGNQLENPDTDTDIDISE